MSDNKRKNMRSFIPEEIPELLLPHIELCSQNRAIVEGCKGVLEYSSEAVRLNCKTLIVSFSGDNLSLCTLCNETVTVTGKILSVGFV